MSEKYVKEGIKSDNPVLSVFKKTVGFGKAVIKFIKKWKGFNHFLPIEQMKMEALEYVNELTQRGGVYSSEFVPKDLRQTKARTIITKSGKPTAGMTTIKDWTTGDDVGLVPLYYSLLFVGMIALNSLGLTGAENSTFSFGLASWFMTNIWLIIGNAIVTLFLGIFLGFSRVKSLFIFGLLIAVNYTVINIHVESSLLNVLTYSFPALSILGLNYLKDLEIGFEKKKQAHEHGNLLGESHIDSESSNPLVVQIQTANEDKTPFIPLGIASGDFSAKGDLTAPEKGSEFGLTVKDLSRHIFYLGKSGGGKSFALRHLAYSVYAAYALNNEKIGMLVIDGKQDLPNELRPLLDVVINPKDYPNIMAHVGLDPDQFANYLAKANGADEKGPNAAFVSNPKTLARNVYRAQKLLMELVDLKLIDKSVEGISASLRYLTTLGRMIMTITPNEENKIIRLLKKHPRFGNDENIRILVEYINSKQQSKSAEQDANLNAQFFQWMDNITDNEEFFPWSSAETNDFDIVDTLKGLRVGYAFKKPSVAADVYIQFFKARLFNALSQRPSESIWRADPTNTSVMIFSDECQNHISAEDVLKASQGRSQGVVLVYASQNMQMVFSALNSKEAVDGLLLNYSNYAFLQSDDKDTDEFIGSIIGKTRTNFVTAPTGYPIAFAETVDQLLKLPEYDPTHPDAHYIKFSKGIKADKFKFGITKGGKDNEINEYRGFAEYRIDPNSPVRALYDDVAKKQLDTPNNAIVRLSRARMPRSDIVKLYGMSLEQLEKSVKILHEEIALNKVLDKIES